MTNLITSLQGYKTYIVAAAAVLTIFAHIGGLIDTSVETTILGLLGFSGLATIGAKINRAAKGV